MPALHVNYVWNNKKLQTDSLKIRYHTSKSQNQPIISVLLITELCLSKVPQRKQILNK